MSLSTYYLGYGRHVGQLRRRRRRRRRRRAYAPTSNTASHDNHEKINLWVPFSFHKSLVTLFASRRFIYLSSSQGSFLLVVE